MTPVVHWTPMKKVSTLSTCPSVNTLRSRSRLPRLSFVKGSKWLSETRQIFRAEGKERVLIVGSRVMYVLNVNINYTAVRSAYLEQRACACQFTSCVTFLLGRHFWMIGFRWTLFWPLVQLKRHMGLPVLRHRNTGILVLTSGCPMRVYVSLTSLFGYCNHLLPE